MSDNWHKTLPPDDVRKRGGTVYFIGTVHGVSRVSANYKMSVNLNVPTLDGLIPRLTQAEAEQDAKR